MFDHDAPTPLQLCPPRLWVHAYLRETLCIGRGVRGRRSVFTPADPPNDVCARPDFHHNVLLHQVETHGDQSHAQHQVHGTQYEAQLDNGTGAAAVTGTRTGTGAGARTDARAGDAVARHEVAEPDGAQRYEAEVRPVKELPGLPFGEQYGASGNVPLRGKKRNKLTIQY